MLLTTSPYSHQMPHYSPYTPPRSSPLSERSANVQHQLFNFTMSSPIKEQPAMPQRVFKSNPVMQSRDATTKRRRDMFFRRVQNNRDDKKWESRGEQIQQLDFVSERKRWEAEKARQAPPGNDDIIEELDEAPLPTLPDNAPHFDPAMTEADYFAAQEEHDLQQLIASMEQESDTRSQHYGSDDEDYDSILMQCTMAEEGKLHQQSQTAPNGFQSEDQMDMEMMDC